jgi:hypothetical protein
MWSNQALFFPSWSLSFNYSHRLFTETLFGSSSADLYDHLLREKKYYMLICTTYLFYTT